jgi:hypothetical protein
VHLEPVFEHTADSEPDKGVIVDHQTVGAFAQDCFRSLVDETGAVMLIAARSQSILAQAGWVR